MLACERCDACDSIQGQKAVAELALKPHVRRSFSSELSEREDRLQDSTCYEIVVRKMNNLLHDQVVVEFVLIEFIETRDIGMILTIRVKMAQPYELL